MEEDTLLVCRKRGKKREDGSGDNSNEHLLLRKLKIIINLKTT